MWFRALLFVWSGRELASVSGLPARNIPNRVWGSISGILLSMLVWPVLLGSTSDLQFHLSKMHSRDIQLPDRGNQSVHVHSMSTWLVLQRSWAVFGRHLHAVCCRDILDQLGRNISINLLEMLRGLVFDQLRLVVQHRLPALHYGHVLIQFGVEWLVFMYQLRRWNLQYRVWVHVQSVLCIVLFWIVFHASCCGV